MESGSSGFSVGCDVELGMAKKRPSSAADYAEIVIQRKGQPALQGAMWVAEGLLTVTSSDGRQKTAQVGNSRPAGLARLMLLELEEERLHGGPLSHSPETTE
jgi:hypothetical protein